MLRNVGRGRSQVRAELVDMLLEVSTLCRPLAMLTLAPEAKLLLAPCCPCCRCGDLSCGDLPHEKVLNMDLLRYRV